MSITSLADLQGKRVALMSRSIHSRVFKQLMNEFQFEFEVVDVPTYLDALQIVEQGKADAAVINRVISLLNAFKFEIVETGIIFNPVEVRFATPKGKHSELLAIIDQHLTLQKQDANSIYYQSLKKWLQQPHKAEVPAWITYSTGIIIFILIVLGISNFLIRKQVAIRTSELSESELRFRQIAENINEVFWIVSPDWKTVYYVSPAYERLWGKNRQDLYKNAFLWFDSIHPDDQKKIKAANRKKAAGDLSDPTYPMYRIISATNKIHWISARAYPIRDDNGIVIRIAGIAEDITNRKEAENKINFMAMHDPLTRLTNRYSFDQELIALIENRKATNTTHALLYIDLDQFKIVNDTCGHAAGDQLLVQLASVLQQTVNDQGSIARLGGDEFGVILHKSTLNDAKKLAQQLLDAIMEFRFIWDDKKFSIGASIGLVMIEDDQLSQVELLSAADMACYAAKEQGRNRVHVYTQGDADLLQRHGEMQWVTRINNAIEENRLVLHRQSIRDLHSSDNENIACYEYLLRLIDEQGTLIFPNSFLPAAERFELMPLLDRWVIKNIFSHLQSQLDAVDQNEKLPLAFINLSGQVFTDEVFLDFIIYESHRCKLDPRNICFEITETAAIGNLKKANQFIQKLRDEGFMFALDDFGTGMSSFSYLKSLPVDFLKIDGIFVKDLIKDPMNSAIVKAVTNIGHQANIQIIAEWVESDEILEQLIAMGVDYAQGYAIDKPTILPDTPTLSLIRNKK